MKLDSAYDPKKTEDRIYKIWEQSGFFNPDKLPGRRTKKFSVMMAPPNITGSLHMGHVLENTEVDILVRVKRMRGFKTLWLPGIDHAGISAQNVVEKELRKLGLRRQDIGREKFIEKVKEWKEKYGTIILDQLKKLGVSPDWSRTRYTLDADYSKAVLEAFNHYYKKHWIYRGERVINWCPRCETGISDLEVEYKEEKSKLYYIKYPLAPRQARGDNDYIVVATTRPETMLGDTAVANLPKSQIINERGIMTAEAGKIYEGLKTGECRDRVVEELQKLGFMEKIEDYKHNVAFCERCGAKIEPRLSKQWFLKMSELAKLALEAIKKKETVIHPKKWEKVLVDRLKNERDWNISRQLWWGHRIPLSEETDVLDTWFSSALWPFATLGWPPPPHTSAAKTPK